VSTTPAATIDVVGATVRQTKPNVEEYVSRILRTDSRLEEERKVMSIKRITIMALVLLALAGTSAMAQPDKGKDWYGYVAGGWTGGLGALGALSDSGWNLNGGFDFRPEAWPVALWGELGYNAMGVTGAVKDQVEVTGGDIDIWSLTGGLLWDPRSKGKVSPYLGAGLGVYRIEGDLTQRVPVSGWYCSPWWPYYCYWGTGTGDAVVASGSTTDWGWNVRGGIAFNLNSLSQIYIEVQYNAIQAQEVLEYMPVVIGFKW